MTLLWFDGFENYADYSDFNVVKSELVSSQNCDTAGYVTFSATYGRNGRGLQNIGSDRYFRFELDSGQSPDEVVFGIALNRRDSDTPAVNLAEPLLAFQDSFAAGNNHIKVCLNASLNFQVYRNDTLLGTSSGKTLGYQTYSFLEIKFKISDSVGYVQMWLDETQILNLAASQDTLEGSNAYVRGVIIRAPYSNIITWFDDMYFLDTSGSAPCNDRLGDVRIDLCLPNGAGAHTDFTPSAGSNYENVDEAGGPDDDTTYNDGGTVGNQDSYAMSDLSALGATIFGLKSQVTCRKTDVDERGYKILTRSGDSDYLSTEINPATTFETQAKVYEVNPDDSLAWEEADINGMEPGVEITT